MAYSRISEDRGETSALWSCRTVTGTSLFAIALWIGCITYQNIALAEMENNGQHLRPCPNSPNCVSSGSSDPSNRIAPIQYDASDSGIMQRLSDVIRDMPRSKIIEFKPNYLRAEFQSLLFRFVDDVEFLINETPGVVHVRSASRMGYWDLGVNRRRVEQIRAELEQHRR